MFMVVALGSVCILLALQYIRSILAIRSLHRQLSEIERGSHMEIAVECRQKDVLVLCRQLNRLRQQWFQDQRQYEKVQKQLKQNITSLAQLARECEEPVRRNRYLQTADDRLLELGDMLEELFLYTKLTSEEFEPELCEIQVLPLLSGCLVGLYRQFEEKGVSPEVEFQSENLRVWADAP